MDLQWKVCPYCGNNHFDPYEVGPPLILAEDVVSSGRETLSDHEELPAQYQEPISEDMDTEVIIQDRLESIEPAGDGDEADPDAEPSAAEQSASEPSATEE